MGGRRKSVTANLTVEDPFSPPLRCAPDTGVEDNRPRLRLKMSVATARSDQQNLQSSLPSIPRFSGVLSFRALREAAPHRHETLRPLKKESRATGEESSEICVVTPKHQRTH